MKLPGDTELARLLERIGVQPVINAGGPNTRLSGAPMDSGVAHVMAAAAQSSFVMDQLQRAAGVRLAEVTGAEAGYVTSGSAAALALGAAACMTGLDVRAMQSLPDTTGLRTDVVIQRAHVVEYSRMLTLAGSRLVEVGYLGYPGGGTTWRWHIDAAITERTAAVAWFAPEAPGVIGLEDLVEIAHRRGVPVIVDASNELPPAANLRRFTAAGADLVCFSGGKAIAGPQASGILVGRRDLIDAVALMHQDMDVALESWAWGREAIASARIEGPPPHGFGRPMKVGKEQIIGLLAALDHFESGGWEETVARAETELDVIQTALQGVPGIRALLRDAAHYPTLVVALDDGLPPVVELADTLLNHGSPGVACSLSGRDAHALWFVGSTLQEGDGGRVATRVLEVLQRAMP